MYPDRAVTTCHTYEIAYRFHYTCAQCGYIYGRHSRSIDTEAMRCGRCQTGRLALSTAAGGAVPKGALAGAGEGAAGEGAAGAAAARPPRTPSAYQRFLADNRKAVAASMPQGTTPQQVMSAVARLWSQHKAAAVAGTDAAPRSRPGVLAEVVESGSDVEHDDGDEVEDVTDKMARTLVL